jgi:TIR domain-containing protein
VSGHVFIACSPVDFSYVDRLAGFLRDAGVDAWYDEAGERWSTNLRDKIESCDAMIVVMSKASDASETVEEEIHLARARRKAFVPLLLEGDPFFGLRYLPYTDVRDGALPPADFIETVRRAEPMTLFSAADRAVEAPSPGVTRARERLTGRRAVALGLLAGLSVVALLAGWRSGARGETLSATVLLAPGLALLLMSLGLLTTRRWTPAPFVLVPVLADAFVVQVSLADRYDPHNPATWLWILDGAALLACLLIALRCVWRAFITRSTSIVESYRGRDLFMATVAFIATARIPFGNPHGPSWIAQIQGPGVAAALLVLLPSTRGARIPVALGVAAFASWRLWALTAGEWTIQLEQSRRLVTLDTATGIVEMSIVIVCALAMAVFRPGISDRGFRLPR